MDNPDVNRLIAARALRAFGDGFVSLEVSPACAGDTEATIAEARRKLRCEIVEQDDADRGQLGPGR